MIIVTGAAGFIGSHIIRGLNARGRTDIIAVDNLKNGQKYRNLANTKYFDYWNCDDFLEHIQAGGEFIEKIEAIFHQGACTTTTEWDGRFMMRNNYQYSKHLLRYCDQRSIPFIYASGSCVYGSSQVFGEEQQDLMPLNVYGYSKWQFDRYLMNYIPKAKSQIVSLRYFNVYGPYEHHKGAMASVALHAMNQLHAKNEIKLFVGSHGYGDGEQMRDFVFVDDAVAVNLWFLDNPKKSGIFNVGTGEARSYNDIASCLIGECQSGSVRYVPFPRQLLSHYQAFTQANLAALRAVGYQEKFMSLEDGLSKYYRWYRH